MIVLRRKRRRRDHTQGGIILIEVSHLTKKYNGQSAVADLSFTILLDMEDPAEAEE